MMTASEDGGRVGGFQGAAQDRGRIGLDPGDAIEDHDRTVAGRIGRPFGVAAGVRVASTGKCREST